MYRFETSQALKYYFRRKQCRPTVFVILLISLRLTKTRDAVCPVRTSFDRHMTRLD